MNKPDAGTTILIVDDEPLALYGAAGEVKAAFASARVEGFGSAGEALEFARSHPCDIALLDIEMPFGGVALGQELQKLYPDINIIFVTGYRDYYKDAMDMYASGYILKPLTREKLEKEFSHLRYPVGDKKPDRIWIQAFGDFQVFVDGVPIRFRYRKTNELMALLVDKKGALCSNERIVSTLWEDEAMFRNKNSYLRNLRQDLVGTLSSYGLEDILVVYKGEMGIIREKVSCDYYQWLKGNKSGDSVYRGEYMNQYSWAEETKGILESYPH